MTVNSTRDFIPPEPFEGQNYKPRYARPSASLREEKRKVFIIFILLVKLNINNGMLPLDSERFRSELRNILVHIQKTRKEKKKKKRGQEKRLTSKKNLTS